MVRCSLRGRRTNNQPKFCFCKSPSPALSIARRWRRSDLGLALRGRTTMAEANDKATVEAAETGSSDESANEQQGRAARPRWRQIFRQAVEKARRDQGTTNRRELGRDHSRSLFFLVGAAIAILLRFLGIFSSPNAGKKSAQTRRPGTPELGRKVTPGQGDPQQAGSATPLLSADVARAESSGIQGVSPDDVSKTARPTQQYAAPAKPLAKNPGQYSLPPTDSPPPPPHGPPANPRPSPE